MKPNNLRTHFFASLLLLSSAIPALPGPRDDLARIDYELSLEQYRIVSMKIFEATLHRDMEPDDPQADRIVQLLERHRARLHTEILERGERLQASGSEASDQESAEIPDGNYIVKLRLSLNGGQDAVVNYQISNGSGRIVAATQSALINATGEFRPVDDGGFGAFFKNQSFGSTQIWKPRDDGSIHILEIPDRGENQIARPIDGPTLAWPEEGK